MITGGSGLLALNWACQMREACEVYLAQHVHRIRLPGAHAIALELEPVEAMLPQFERYRPEVIVHTAGLASVDQCENEPRQAHQANAVLARNVAVAAARLGLRLIHISTDHLFGGTRPLYQEGDVPQPLNVYARTKLQAEHWVVEAHPGALIVRTNFFGWGHRLRRSFSDWILDALTAGQPLTLFDDVYFTPILIDRLARAAHELSSAGQAGIYHISGDDRISKFDFALRLARRFALPEALIRRGRISQAHLAARRPSDMSLDNAKARAALGAGLGSAEEHIDALRRQQLSGRQAQLLQSVDTE